MEVLKTKATAKKVVHQRKPKRNLMEEYPDEDDTPVVAIVKSKRDRLIPDDVTLPAKIEVKQNDLLRSVVPGHVFRQGTFKFKPQTFAAEAESLNERFIEPKVQFNSLDMFLKDPTLRMIYGVSGNPDDSKAKYFAAYLVQQHMKHLGSHAVVVWNPLYGGFGNSIMDRDDNSAVPTMIVLTNLTPVSTNFKLEKARDIIEKYNDIPRVIVTAGMDPLSFLATKLFVPVHGMAYFHESLVRQKVEII